MSRIGRLPVAIPSGVDVKIDGQTVSVKGPKGQLSRTFHENMKIGREAERKGLGGEVLAYVW